MRQASDIWSVISSPGTTIGLSCAHTAGVFSLALLASSGCGAADPDVFEAVLHKATDPEGMPLVVLLHGRSGSAEGILERTGMKEAAGEAASVLSVQALPIFNGSTGWDLASAEEHARLWSSVDEALTETGADADRVILVGYSLGGMMVVRAACDAPERVAGMALVAGAMETSLVDDCAQEATPALFFHGKADTSAPWEGTRTTLSVDEILGFWVNSNDCLPTTQTTEVEDTVDWDESTASRHTWSECQGLDVGLFELAKAGHSWPGSPQVKEGTSGINMDVDASAEIVAWLVDPQ